MLNKIKIAAEETEFVRRDNKKSIVSRTLLKLGKFYVLLGTVLFIIALCSLDIYKMLTENHEYNYTFGSTMVNYSAGFVRRGLFGEIIELMNWICQPFAAEMLLSFASLLLILCLFLARMVKLNVGLPYIVAITVSPSLFLMHRGEEFFRTDTILIALNLAASCFILRCLSTGSQSLGNMKKQSFTKMLAIDTLILTLLASSALIHELSVTLLPPVILLFLLYCKKTGRTVHCIAVSLALAVIYALLVTRFKFSDAGIIAKSWSGIFNISDSFQGNDGLRAIADKATALRMVNQAKSTFPELPIKIIFHMFVAIATPLIILMLSGITVFHSASSRSRGLRRLLIVSCLCPLGLSITAIDYGRWFSISAINIIAYALLTAHKSGRTFGKISSEKIRRMKSVAKQYAAIIIAVILMNYEINYTGYFHKKTTAVWDETKQMVVLLPDFTSRLEQLFTRELVVKPFNGYK